MSTLYILQYNTTPKYNGGDIFYFLDDYKAISFLQRKLKADGYKFFNSSFESQKNYSGRVDNNYEFYLKSWEEDSSDTIFVNITTGELN